MVIWNDDDSNHERQSIMKLISVLEKLTYKIKFIFHSTTFRTLRKIIVNFKKWPKVVLLTFLFDLWLDSFEKN